MNTSMLLLNTHRELYVHKIPFLCGRCVSPRWLGFVIAYPGDYDRHPVRTFLLLHNACGEALISQTPVPEPTCSHGPESYTMLLEMTYAA